MGGKLPFGSFDFFWPGRSEGGIDGSRGITRDMPPVAGVQRTLIRFGSARMVSTLMRNSHVTTRPAIAANARVRSISNDVSRRL